MSIIWLLVVATLADSALCKVVSEGSANLHQPSHSKEHDGHYTNEWVVKVAGGPAEAHRLSEEKGYIFRGEVFGLKDTYLLEKSEHPARHKRDASHITESLLNDDRVSWSEQQRIQVRTKRDHIDLEPEDRVVRRKRPDVLPEYMPVNENDDAENSAGEELEFSEFYQEKYELPQNIIDDEIVVHHDKRDTDILEYTFELLGHVVELLTGGATWRHRSKGQYNRFNDELWAQQWYMNQAPAGLLKRSTGYDSGPPASEPLIDMNIIACYDAGLTGKGIRVSILDDGIEHTHKDLSANYEKDFSYDMNGNDSDPTPQYNDQNAHGTRCAGEVAMIANNRKCGVGVAYNARIGGIRLLDGPVTDRLEAAALGYRNDIVDIYSASWGPTDDGQTVDGPGRLTREALINGVTKGRNGKGTIFVWAAGNGGSKGDSCACDGYVNSHYTLTVSSASETGKFPWYGEKCAAILAATYSSGGMREGLIVAADLKNKCTDRHSGTSASAPIAAGIVALLLEQRPDLTWRDVQHLVVYTSRPWPLRFNKGWQTNAAGLRVNSRFGFGLMDAYGLTSAAKDWTLVPEQTMCNTTFEVKNAELTINQMIRMTVPMDCPDVQYLESVQLAVNLASQNRGTLEVYLRSPLGLKTQLLYQRYKDKSTKGFSNWKFLSVMTWGENPNGNWTVEVIDKCKTCKAGTMGNFSIYLYGTKEKPAYLRLNVIKKVEHGIEKMKEEMDNDSYETSEWKNLLRGLKGMI